MCECVPEARQGLTDRPEYLVCVWKVGYQYQNQCVPQLLDPSLRILPNDEGAGAVGWNYWVGDAGGRGDTGERCGLGSDPVVSALQEYRCKLSEPN
jgi:hypothetical protein